MSEFITPVNEFFTPIQKMLRIGEIPNEDNSINKTSGATEPFSNFMTNAINNVIETDKQLAMDVQAVATGQSDDLHSVLISQTKASLAVDVMVQFRNKFLDAYNELIRMGV